MNPFTRLETWLSYRPSETALAECREEFRSIDFAMRQGDGLWIFEVSDERKRTVMGEGITLVGAITDALDRAERRI